MPNSYATAARRLSRDVSFIFSLRNAEVDFVACGIPDANTLTVGIMAVLAQHERELIGDRTRAALAAKKAQGHKLGMANITPEVTRRGVVVRLQNAQTNLANRQATELVRLYRKDGLTYRAIAERLNQMGYQTRRGQEFLAMSVKRLAGKP